MLNRFCPNCGTEVDDTAVFCPTCGQPIDEASETLMPAAPAWPDPAPTRPVEPPPSDEGVTPAPAWSSEPVASEPEPPPPVPVAGLSRPAAPPPTPAAGVAHEAPPAPPPPSAAAGLPITTPVTLSGWLIGVGAALAALGLLIALLDGRVNPVDFLLILALVGIAASVFAAASLPAFAHLRLATMAVAFIGFGMALDRIGLGAAGAGDLLFFLGTAAAGIGAVLVELGQDQPLGGPSS
jgi:zinc-ribbon domain